MTLTDAARPCDEDGDYLPPNSPPPPRPHEEQWAPFESRSSFETAELLFEKVEMSKGEIDRLLQIWAAHDVELGREPHTPFKSHKDLFGTIDEIDITRLSWQAFNIRFIGEVDDDSPSWKRERYTIYTRSTLDVLRSMLQNPQFDGHFDYRPFEEYVGPNQRQWSNLMSGTWAWKQAVSPIMSYIRTPCADISMAKSTIAQDPMTHGAMLCPVIGGADKTTVSVATGHIEYHPVYTSCGNLTNTMRRAHRESVVPTAFLAIPKGICDIESQLRKQ